VIVPVSSISRDNVSGVIPFFSYKSIPAATGARWVISESGDILSPKLPGSLSIVEVLQEASGKVIYEGDFHRLSPTTMNENIVGKRHAFSLQAGLFTKELWILNRVAPDGAGHTMAAAAPTTQL
jgi:hypothetical protein